MTLIEDADYFIRLVDLPAGVSGIVSPNEDGTYNIYLDARKGRFDRIDDYTHECIHILRDDFGNDLPLNVIESS